MATGYFIGLPDQRLNTRLFSSRSFCAVYDLVMMLTFRIVKNNSIGDEAFTVII